MTPADFVRRAFEAAKEAKEAGAPIVPGVAAAQAALESAYGRSKLATEANNLFGIKAGSRWHGAVLALPTREWNEHVGWQTVNARWRKYDSWQDCFRDYGRLIAELPWFADAKAAASRNDAEGFLSGLLPNAAEPGWATDPAYRDKIATIAEDWGLLWDDAYPF